MDLSKDEWEWPRNRRSQFRYIKALRPTESQITENRSALGKVAHVCHHLTDLDVNIVTACGSVGKKTDSTLCSDLDLVVRVNGLPVEHLKHEVHSILDKIELAMDEQYPGTRDTEWYRKFGLRYMIEDLEIDILVGATGVMPRDFFNVPDAEDRAYMSASVSHLAKRFIRGQNLMFKDLVRVVKHWRDSYESWPPACKPKSYLLELVMLHTFLQFDLCKKSTGRTKHPYPIWWANRILLEFFRILSEVPRYNGQPYSKNNLPNLFVCFEPYYKQNEVDLDSPEPIFATTRKVGHHGKKSKTRYATAIVLDPVNPTNNVWLTLGDSGALLGDRCKKTYQSWDKS